MFDRLGEIVYPRAAGSDDAVMEAAIEAGADDCETDKDGHWLTASVEAYHEVSAALEAKLGPAKASSIVWRPQNTVDVDEEKGEKLLKLIELARRFRRRAGGLREFRDEQRGHGEAERVSASVLLKRAAPQTRAGLGSSPAASLAGIPQSSSRGAERAAALNQCLLLQPMVLRPPVTRAARAAGR